ncbi:unnamed protein product [Leptidea sinapis]|uniref:Exostosin GT47 domain-containing protein n=1 Tax=Leptidea sinapis TaxID=189913 RepID=A0A5E4QSG4_9NEOP|nr:unnamed protein product [Leptidea sinapis]
MAAVLHLKTNKHPKHTTYRKIFYHRFFVGLLIFIVVSLLFTIVLNIFAGSAPRKDFHENLRLDVGNLPIQELKNNSPYSTARAVNCTYWNCFNVYKCGRGGHDKITIYIYPLQDYRTEEGKPISHFSKEFYQILNTIKHSKYYTPNPNEACLFVPSIDTLNQHSFSSVHVSQALQSLEFWNNGENHLIFNMVSGLPPNYNTVVDLNTSDAIIAGAGFSTWTFRYGFDVSLPLYSPLAYRIDNTQPKHKDFLIISSQTNIPQDYLSDLQNIASSSNDLLLLDRCMNTDDYTKRCEYTTGTLYNYPDVLKNGLFCLVVRSARLIQAVLMDVIASQCIPIIIADTIVMPFNSHVDWNRIAIFIPEENIKNLLKIVHSVSKERRGELFWQLRWVYEKYFASMERITLTTLEILNEKYGPVNPLFLPVTAPKAAGFTAVILTYDRVESLFTLIKKLVRTPSLAKILVIWNNQKKPPPAASEWPVISKPLKVIRTKENKLSNRFYPYDDIETECQLTIDDDIIMLTPDELEFGFDVWREFPDRIVGFPSRLHVWDNVTSSWKYHSEWTNQISMVAPRKKFKCPECTNTEMLSADARYMTQRSACVDRFAKIYGHMALRSVEFRADPLQYLETSVIPPLYPNIGAL